MATHSWRLIVKTYGGKPPDPTKGLWQDPIMGFFETHGKFEFKPGGEYDLSPANKRAVWERNRIKELMKIEYLRREFDPIRRKYINGNIIDPALFRWYAADASQFETFRMTPKTIFVGLCMVFAPAFAWAAYIIRDRFEGERMCRKGQLLWWDRQDFRMVTRADMGVSICHGHAGMYTGP